MTTTKTLQLGRDGPIVEFTEPHEADYTLTDEFDEFASYYLASLPKMPQAQTAYLKAQYLLENELNVSA